MRNLLTDAWTADVSDMEQAIQHFTADNRRFDDPARGQIVLHIREMVFAAPLYGGGWTVACPSVR